MAIYTQYGRYLKAKMFKDMLDGPGPCEAYMVLGMGNPYWDSSDPAKRQPMPIAPFNSKILINPGATENQFYDNNVALAYTDADATCVYTMESGIPSEGSFIDMCKNILPPVPGLWVNDSYPITILTMTDANNNANTYGLSQSDWGNALIKKEDARYKLYVGGIFVAYADTIPEDEIEAQVFAELYLRGLATYNGVETHPAGLLGVVKCKIDFVKDIGGVENYTGDIDEFFYGDRYWKIVTDNEEQLIARGEYPHHLRFTSTINLRNLCTDINIDRYLVPRQLSIYARKKKVIADNPTSGSGENTVLNYESGKSFYRVGENVFNFGQYDNSSDSENTEPIGPGEVLDFTLPVDGDKYPDGDFKFLLNDYIHGHVREVHSVDRFGYIVGF